MVSNIDIFKRYCIAVRNFNIVTTLFPILVSLIIIILFHNITLVRSILSLNRDQLLKLEVHLATQDTESKTILVVEYFTVWCNYFYLKSSQFSFGK